MPLHIIKGHRIQGSEPDGDSVHFHPSDPNAFLGAGWSMSRSSSTSRPPYRSWKIAFMVVSCSLPHRGQHNLIQARQHLSSHHVVGGPSGTACRQRGGRYIEADDRSMAVLARRNIGPRTSFGWPSSCMAHIVFDATLLMREPLLCRAQDSDEVEWQGGPGCTCISALDETTRQAGSRLTLGRRTASFRSGSGWSRYRTEASSLAPRQAGGNLSGNPGATTRRYRTALDEIAPALEQPRWCWAGPVGRFRSDS
jgi:hypothetical protein